MQQPLFCYINLRIIARGYRDCATNFYEIIFQTIVLFVAACIGIFVVGWVLPCWKLVGDRDLAVGIGVEQFLGFPSNVVICREVSEAVGKTDDEKTYIEETLSVPYVVGGITVVTILSVTLAGIVINFL